MTIFLSTSSMMERELLDFKIRYNASLRLSETNKIKDYKVFVMVAG